MPNTHGNQVILIKVSMPSCCLIFVFLNLIKISPSVCVWLSRRELKTSGCNLFDIVSQLCLFTFCGVEVKKKYKNLFFLNLRSSGPLSPLSKHFFTQLTNVTSCLWPPYTVRLSTSIFPLFLCCGRVNDAGVQGLLYSWPYYLSLTAPLLFWRKDERHLSDNS